MIGKKLKEIIQGIAHKYGYHILSKSGISGDMELFLKAIKSRDFNPKNILDVGPIKVIGVKWLQRFSLSLTFF